MNTPKPCFNCHYCYADAPYKKDSIYQAECLLSFPLGIDKCQWFRYWDSPECRKEYRAGQHWDDAREFRATGRIKRLELKTK